MANEVENIGIDLPEIIDFNDYGNWDDYIEELYAVFKRDFIDSIPLFRGIKLGLKKHPEFQGKEATFYHVTHEGQDENDRTPDLRRCERLEWLRLVIENCDAWGLKVWKKVVRSDKRILILLEQDDLDYLVILSERNGYLLPWTAYSIRGKKRAKYIKEYEEYINAGAA